MFLRDLPLFLQGTERFGCDMTGQVSRRLGPGRLLTAASREDMQKKPGQICWILLQFVEFNGNVKETWPPKGRPEKIDRKDDRHETPARADVVRLPADPAVPARHGGERD